MVRGNVFQTCYNGGHSPTPTTTTTTDYVIQPSQLIGMADSLDRNSFAKETNKHKTHSNSNTTHGIESDEGYQSPDLLLHTESEYYDVY